MNLDKVIDKVSAMMCGGCAAMAPTKKPPPSVQILFSETVLEDCRQDGTAFEEPKRDQPVLELETVAVPERKPDSKPLPAEEEPDEEACAPEITVQSLPAESSSNDAVQDTSKSEEEPSVDEDRASEILIQSPSELSTSSPQDVKCETMNWNFVRTPLPHHLSPKALHHKKEEPKVKDRVSKCAITTAPLELSTENFKYATMKWNDLPTEARDAAELFGYTKEKWDEANQNPAGCRDKKLQDLRNHVLVHYVIPFVRTNPK